MPKPAKWILVADSSKARCFRAPKRDEKFADTLVHELNVPSAPSRDINSDRPGRTFDRGGEGRHAQEPPTDPHRHAKFQFAQELAKLLENERNKGAYDSLTVVAPPQFLGDLRATLSDNVRKCVTQEINKDLTMLSVHELESHLRDKL
jgi:protein required for attachment to host cells